MGCGSSNGVKEVDNPKKITVKPLGGPGSGKGTQCDRLKKDYGFLHISTVQGGPDAEQIESYIKEGKLVPSEMLVKLIQKEFATNGYSGKYLLDGFPRNQENLTVWNKMVGTTVDVQFLLYVECSFEVMEQRLLKRGETSGRADDNPETIKKRFHTFQTETQPIVTEFEKLKKIEKVNSEKTVGEVYVDIQVALEKKKITQFVKPSIIFISGPPGSGKRTQSDWLNEEFEFQHISLGDLLRCEIESNGSLANLIKQDVAQRNPVDSDLVAKILRKKIMSESSSQNSKFVISGFPRNPSNLQSFHKILSDYVELKIIFFLNCDFETCQSRLQETGKESSITQESFDKFYNQRDQLLEVIKEQENIQCDQFDANYSEDKVYKQIRASIRKLELHTTTEGKAPNKKPGVICIIGGPGSGKGTQCEKLLLKYNDLKHLSTGDILREEEKKGGNDAKALQQFMKEGKLVPSSLLIKLVKQKIEAESKTFRKFLLDGFPRSKENVKEWEIQIKKSIKIKTVLVYDCSLEVMTERLLSRAKTSGRADDNPETIKKRLETFMSETQPIIQYFEKKGKVIKVNADRDPDDVFQETVEQLTRIKFLKNVNQEQEGG